MKKLLAFFIFSILLVHAGAFAENNPAAEENPTFSQQELDQMLAPIALYPDSLLSQVLMAATYPLEVVQAARWASANPTLSGDAAVQAVDNQNWEASVKAMVAFPQVLQTMDQKIEWTERLGDAFLAQQVQVMDTIQNLRQKAQTSGNLNSNSQVVITQSDNNIEVAPTHPETVYVPYYDPAVVYGNWWWADYPPVYWAPWGGYGWSSGIAWGIGIGVGAHLLFGAWDWRGHGVYTRNHGSTENGRPWLHDPNHRHGVPYRNENLHRQFGRTTATPALRAEYRGHTPEVRAQAGEHGGLSADPHQQNSRTHTLGASGSRNNAQTVEEPRPHALENVGHATDARNFSARGNASLPGKAAESPQAKGGQHRARH